MYNLKENVVFSSYGGAGIKQLKFEISRNFGARVTFKKIS